MDTRFWLEMIGYTGSVLVAISLMMKSLLRLRLINLVGAAVFVIYGLLIGAYPVALLNGLIVGIDLYYLFQMWRQKDYFTLLEVSPDGTYLRGFVDFYKDEIAAIFPDYTHAPRAGQVALFVLRNMVPAGLLIIEPDGQQARVLLDYVIPGYRDFRIGKFLFEDHADYFTRRGITSLTATAGVGHHARYLERMGFRREGNQYIRNFGGMVISDREM